jgi:hypothetical protein
MLSRFAPFTLIGIVLAWGGVIFAADATKPANPARLETLRAELEVMHQSDQAQRQLMDQVRREHGQNSVQMRELWTKQNTTDAYNIKRLEEIIAEIGWPKRSEVGERAASAAFLILQHSDLSYQKKYLPLAREAVAANEMRGSSLALLEDRILLREGKKQIYGSQVRQNDAGQWEASSLEDPANVDQRRASVGLGPLAQYLAGFAQRSGGTVADGKGDAAMPDAPALTQNIFEASDTASQAYAKLKAAKPGAGPAGIELQRACRDFCARFPNSALYGAVRVMAARYWAMLSNADRSALPDWDPGSAEQDGKLNREQQAAVAAQMALASVRPTEWGRWIQSRLEAMTSVARRFPGSAAVRDELIPAALDAAPEIAAPLLRELYPDDAMAIAATKVIEAVGQRFEFQLVTVDGRSLSAADFRGKVTMLLFATDASYVDAVIQQLKVVAEKHGRDDFAIALVSMSKTPAAVTDFLQRNAIDWPAQSDGLGSSTPLMTRMMIRVVPYYLLLDRDGRLRYRGLSPGSGETGKRIAALVAATPAALKN